MGDGLHYLYTQKYIVETIVIAYPLATLQATEGSVNLPLKVIRDKGDKDVQRT